MTSSSDLRKPKQTLVGMPVDFPTLTQMAIARNYFSIVASCHTSFKTERNRKKALNPYKICHSQFFNPKSQI
ncbi:MAG: hypothetical protein EAZ60_09785 [Oscillatoriales cyanobacterium]|nr:MAG: hypothetical protein EAZ60_09785 [Oscillatoriales cyanobacterium]